MMRRAALAFVLCAMLTGCRTKHRRPVEQTRGRISVRGSASSAAEVTRLADDAVEIDQRLAALFGQDDPQFPVGIMWLPRTEWERDIPALLPYGMPFATPEGLIVLPACNLEVPQFLHDITDAAGAPRATATECTDYYAAILAHELFHVYWSHTGYPREPVWLREGMAQTAVLAARDWPRLGAPARAWLALNDQLYQRGVPGLPTRDIAELARQYQEITPLQYSWLLARMFLLFDELDIDLAAIPKAETITDEEAAAALDSDRDWAPWGIP